MLRGHLRGFCGGRFFYAFFNLFLCYEKGKEKFNEIKGVED